jgi:hypothetical protein
VAKNKNKERFANPKKTCVISTPCASFREISRIAAAISRTARFRRRRLKSTQEARDLGSIAHRVNIAYCAINSKNKVRNSPHHAHDQLVANTDAKLLAKSDGKVPRPPAKRP